MRQQKPENRQNQIQRLAAQLETLRNSLGLTQQALAAEIGITRQTYAKLERGELQMGYTTYLAFLYYFQKNQKTAQFLEEQILSEAFSPEQEKTTEYKGD